MKIDRKLTAALLAGCLSVGLAVPAAAAQELTATYGEAKYQTVAMGAYSRQLKVHNGKLVAQDTNGRYGLIDLNGNAVIPFQYNGMEHLLGDFYWVGSCPKEQFYWESGQKAGIVREDGQVIIPMQEKGISVYHDKIRVGDQLYDGNMLPLAEEPHEGGMGHQPPAPWTYYDEMDSGYVEVKDAEGRFNILDQNGTPIFEFGAYDGANPLTSRGACMFELYKGSDRALAAADGQIVVPLGTYSGFSNTPYCSDILAYNGDQSATLDSRGNPLIPLGEYNFLYSSNPQGYAVASIESYEPLDSGLPNYVYTFQVFRNGTLVGTYSDLTLESDENSPLLKFSVEKYVGPHGLMTGDGQEVVPAIYDMISFGDTGIITAQSDRYNLLTLDGTPVLENLSDIQTVGDGLYLVREAGKWGVYSLSASGSGAYLIAPQFEELIYRGGRLLLAKENGLYQLYDIWGKAITEPSVGQPYLFSMFGIGEEIGLFDALIMVQWGPGYGDNLPADVQPFVVKDTAGVYTLYMNYKTGEVLGRLPVEASNINEDGWFAYCGENGLIGLGHVDASANTGPSGWAANDVKAAIDAGLVPEQLKELYTQPTTRAEFCALAVQLYETVTGTEVKERKQFSDTTDVNVEKAAALGVVDGIGNGLFSPNATLTREQAAAMLSRLAAAVKKPLAGQTMTFSDAGSVSGWAAESVGQMQTSGIMGGVGENRFDPQGLYTREQSIITVLRLYQNVK